MTRYCFGWLGWTKDGTQVPLIAVADSVETARCLLEERELALIAERTAWYAKWKTPWEERYQAAFMRYCAAIEEGAIGPPDLPVLDLDGATSASETAKLWQQAGAVFHASPEYSALRAEQTAWPPRPHSGVALLDDPDMLLADPPDWQVPVAQPGAYWTHELGTA